MTEYSTEYDRLTPDEQNEWNRLYHELLASCKKAGLGLGKFTCVHSHGPKPAYVIWLMDSDKHIDDCPILWSCKCKNCSVGDLLIAARTVKVFELGKLVATQRLKPEEIKPCPK